MATSKKTAFETPDVQLATWAKALSHPARIAILKVLAVRNTCICGEIVDELPLAQATVSQHLKALKEAGFISGEVEGPRMCYCLNWDELERFRTAAADLFEQMKNAAASCC